MSLDAHRLRTLLVRAELAATQDQLLRRLSRAAGDSTLGRDTGLAHRMTSAVGSTCATTQRMVDGVHRLGTRVRANAHVTGTTGFADRNVDPVEIAELADRRAAGAANATHFAGRQNDHAVHAFFGAQASDATGGADKLAALAGVHFDVVNFQTTGDVRQRKRVSDFRGSIRATDHRRADFQTIRGEDIRLFA